MSGLAEVDDRDTQKYANEPATRCNSFIAAFILFYFTCAAGLTSSAERLRCL